MTARSKVAAKGKMDVLVLFELEVKRVCSEEFLCENLVAAMGSLAIL